MTPELADALATDSGRRLLALAAAVPPAEELAAATRLRASYPPDLVAAAFAQAELRRRAAAKFSRAADMLFTRDGLEQATPEVVARRRADRLGDFVRVADLCCGIGGDLIALARDRQVLAVDRDPLHLRLAVHNLGVYGAASGVVGGRVADVREVDLSPADAVFVDPARRAGDRRLGAVATEPPLEWAIGLAADRPVVIKAAPGLPHEAVPAGWELEFVSVGGELKEACLWSPQLARARTRATLLPRGAAGASVVPALELLPAAGEPLDVRAPGGWLLDPDPAVTRAGLVQELGRTVGAWQLDERIAFLSADHPLRTPFGRCLRVLEAGPYRLKDLAAAVRRHGIGAVDIRRRGLAGDVEAIRRRLPLAGTRRATVALTRVGDRPWAVLAEDAAEEES